MHDASARGAFKRPRAGAADPRASVGRDDGDREAPGLPRSHVVRGPRGALCGSAVPDRELPRLGIEVARSKQCKPHGELRPVSEEDVVAEEGVFGRVAHGRRRGETAVEALDPSRARGRDRDLDEFVSGEREHDMQFRIPCEQGLGAEDVAAARERAVGIAGGMAADLLSDPVRHDVLRVGWETTLQLAG